MSPPNPRSVHLIAIALAVLKFKPRDQSTASYLLDLQSHFPFATNDRDGRDWRTYALELEKQLTAFKTQRDADQGRAYKPPLRKFQLTRVECAPVLSKLVDASQLASTPDAPPPKKKSKRSTNKDSHDPEWSWDQSRADWSRFLSSQWPSAPSLSMAYASLKGVLASPNEDILLHASRLTDAVVRALDTIHVFMFSSPNPGTDQHTQVAFGTPSQLNPQHIDNMRIAMASPLLMYLLRSAFPALLHTVHGTHTKSKRQRQHMHSTAITTADSHAHVDRALNHLLELVLLPLIRALVPLCFARFALLVAPFPKKPSRPVGKGKSKDNGKGKGTNANSLHPKKHTDTRTDAFALIGASLEALDSLTHPVRLPNLGGIITGNLASGIRDRLGLETIRCLEGLYAAPPSPLSPFEPFSGSASGPQQPPPLRSEAPLTSTPLSVPPQSQPQSQSRTQQSNATESRTKQLERLTGTRAERVRALATRDAGWFLASTLNLCVTPPAPVPAAGPDPFQSVTGGQLRETLLSRIGKLVPSLHEHDEHSHIGLAIDPVCRNMLLAICERTMTQLTS